MEKSIRSLSVIVGCMLWLSQGEVDDSANWEGNDMLLGHLWDCNGMACDADTLQPWDEYRYISSPDYAPQDPAEHGGAVYGERLWLVGRATDAVSQMFADGSEEETCCGADPVGGCGRCLLIQSPDAVQNEWTAVVMKKSHCRPWIDGCETPIKRFDIAVPGYDVESNNRSNNVCANRSGTVFESKADPYLMGKWDQEPGISSTADPRHLELCDRLPKEFINGCRLFSKWGWSAATPGGVKYRKVKCPEKFKEWVGKKFTSDGVVTKGWSGQNLHVRHFWNCAGMSCDEATMKTDGFESWRLQWHFVASPAYGPQDPEMHGGAEYGEKMWLVGAASDTLSGFLGADDPCCGKDWNSPGCGKCLLIQNPDAVQGNWSAVVMKKSRCHPARDGCGKNEVHLDLAVPGFDELSEGRAEENVCGKRDRTLFDGPEQSAVLGKWYEEGNSTAASIHKCDWLSAPYRPSCKLFASWGWTSHAPENVKFKRVECPARFVQWIEGAFDEYGVSHTMAWPTTTTTTTLTITTQTTTTMSSTTATSSSGPTSTTTEASQTFLGQETPRQSSASPTLMLTVVASCAGVLCFVSCTIACCGSKSRS